MTIKVVAKAPVVLVPVLEVPPYHYSALPLPTVVGAREHPTEWSDYFQRCMADAGFPAIEPVRPGSMHVRARALAGHPLLVRMVREALDGSGLPGFPTNEALADLAAEDRVGGLEGGFALFAEGQVLIEPGCCSDLGTLSSWEDALRHRSSAATIWVGHPELGVSFDHDAVTLKEGWEYPPAPTYLMEVTLAVGLLEAAVQSARLELKCFREELLPVVAQFVEGTEVARLVLDRLLATPVERSAE